MSGDQPTVPTLSVRQAADVLGVGVVSVRRGIDTGLFPGWRDGRRYRVDRARLAVMVGYPADHDFGAARDS